MFIICINSLNASSLESTVLYIYISLLFIYLLSIYCLYCVLAAMSGIIPTEVMSYTDGESVTIMYNTVPSHPHTPAHVHGCVGVGVPSHPHTPAHVHGVCVGVPSHPHTPAHVHGCVGVRVYSCLLTEEVRQSCT